MSICDSIPHVNELEYAIIVYVLDALIEKSRLKANTLNSLFKALIVLFWGIAVALFKKVFNRDSHK